MPVPRTDVDRSENPSPSGAQGDPGASFWIARHQAGLWRYLRFLGCPSGLAEDLTQDSFLAALQKGVEDRGPEASAAWLRTTARNLWFMHLRRKRSRPDHLSLELEEAVFVEQMGDEDGSGYLEALDLCLARLEPRQREAIDLRYADGASREVMAERLGMGEEGIKALLRRLRERLRQCVERRLGGGSR